MNPVPATTPIPDIATLHTDVLVLGAGAAGLMCARVAARRGRTVVLLDHAAVPGRKIAVSGGGKANFTNLHMGSEYFVGENTAFCEPALEAFTPRHILSLLAEHGLAWEEREHGQLFGLESAARLTEALLRDCTAAGCRFALEHSIETVEHTPQGFTVQARHKGKTRTLHAASLVLALGSPAWPQVGASDAGTRWARHLGHTALPFHPVLTPLRMPGNWPLQGLSGISLKASLRTADARAKDGAVYEREDDLLFTHSGISGPAVLQMSCRWQPGQEIIMDFLPHALFAQLLDAPEHGKLLVRTLLGRVLPQRLADALLPDELARRKVAELSRAARTRLRDCVHSHRVIPAGHEGLRRAEAAAGGVSTSEINARSMESLRVPGLFMVGELLDVTGHLGGYNLHWAWASGHMAGIHA